MPDQTPRQSSDPLHSDIDPLVSRLLDTQDRLIALLAEAVAKADPVALVAALNPPANPTVYMEPPTPYGTDSDHQGPRLDPWGDEAIPNEEIIPGLGGWVGVPGLEEAKAQVIANGGDENA